MKILLIRHAEPDYSVDGLTVKGEMEAELLSRYLQSKRIDDIYSSPLGRAKLTASYTLRKKNMTAQVLPWLAEFRARMFDPEQNRMKVIWDQKPRKWADHEQLFDREAWTQDPLLLETEADTIWQETKAGVDELMARYGYVKDGCVWRCERNDDKTIALFCHFGIATVVMGYLLNVPPFPLLQTMCMQPSSITTLITQERIKGEVDFRCIRYGDMSHLEMAGERMSTAGLYPQTYTGVDSTNPPEWTRKPEITPLQQLFT